MTSNLIAGSNLYQNGFFHYDNIEIENWSPRDKSKNVEEHIRQCVEECKKEWIENAERFYDLLECGSHFVTLDESHENWSNLETDDVHTSEKVDYKTLLSFCDQTWPEAKILLSWIYLYIFIHGGTFRINASGVYIEQIITKGFCVKIKINSINNNNWTVTSGPAEKLITGHSCVIVEIGNYLKNLSEKNQGDDSHSLGVLKLEDFNTQDSTFWSSDWNAEALTYFDIAPWTKLNMDEYLY